MSWTFLLSLCSCSEFIFAEAGRLASLAHRQKAALLHRRQPAPDPQQFPGQPAPPAEACTCANGIPHKRCPGAAYGGVLAASSYGNSGTPSAQSKAEAAEEEFLRQILGITAPAKGSTDSCTSCHEGYRLHYTSSDYYIYEDVDDGADASSLSNKSEYEDGAEDKLRHAVRENTRCERNVCHCPNGTAASVCPLHGDHQCEACDEGYYLDGTRVCQKNACVCAHGNGPVGGQCPAHGMEFCTSCHSGYWLDDPADVLWLWDDPWATMGYGNGYEQDSGAFSSSSSPYPEEEATYVPIGEPPAEAMAALQTKKRSSSSTTKKRKTSGSTLTSPRKNREKARFLQLLQKSKAARAGAAQGTSAAAGQAAEDDFFKAMFGGASGGSGASSTSLAAASASAKDANSLYQSQPPPPTCRRNECYCTEGGDPAVGIDCPSDGQEVCQFCWPGFHLEGNLCKKDVCFCAHGIAPEAVDVVAAYYGWSGLQAHREDAAPPVAAQQAFSQQHQGALLHKQSENVKSSSLHLHKKGMAQRAGREALFSTSSRGLQSSSWMPAGGATCSRHAAHVCSECTDPAYYLDEAAARCLPKVCSCEYGSATVGEKICIFRTSKKCSKHGAEECARCRHGYELAPAPVPAVPAVDENYYDPFAGEKPPSSSTSSSDAGGPQVCKKKKWSGEKEPRWEKSQVAGDESPEAEESGRAETTPPAVEPGTPEAEEPGRVEAPPVETPPAVEQETPEAEEPGRVEAPPVETPPAVEPETPEAEEPGRVETPSAEADQEPEEEEFPPELPPPPEPQGTDDDVPAVVEDFRVYYAVPGVCRADGTQGSLGDFETISDVKKEYDCQVLCDNAAPAKDCKAYEWSFTREECELHWATVTHVEQLVDPNPGGELWCGFRSLPYSVGQGECVAEQSLTPTSSDVEMSTQSMVHDVVRGLSTADECRKQCDFLGISEEAALPVENGASDPEHQGCSAYEFRMAEDQQSGDASSSSSECVLYQYDGSVSMKLAGTANSNAETTSGPIFECGVKTVPFVTVAGKCEFESDESVQAAAAASASSAKKLTGMVDSSVPRAIARQQPDLETDSTPTLAHRKTAHFFLTPEHKKKRPQEDEQSPPSSAATLTATIATDLSTESSEEACRQRCNADAASVVAGTGGGSGGEVQMPCNGFEFDPQDGNCKLRLGNLKHVYQGPEAEDEVCAVRVF
eukprot:g19833.t1